MSLHVFDGGSFRLAARANAGKLEALVAERITTEGPHWNEIHRGRVRIFNRGLGAAFLDLGKAGEAFLPCPDKEEILRRENPLVVRIVAPAREGKLALARMAKIDGTPPGPPARLQKAPSLLSWVLAGEDSTEKARAWPPTAHGEDEQHGFARGDTRDESLEVLEEISKLCQAEVVESAEFRLCMEPTTALVAVDVDGPGGNVDADEAASRLGLATAPAIAQQVALRNFSGLIVVDFVRLSSAAARNKVVAAVRRAFRTDPRVTRVGRMSPSGTVEIVRAREGPALHEVLGMTNRGGVDLRFATLLAELKLARAARTGLRGTIEATASPPVATLLSNAETAQRIGRSLKVVADASLGDLDLGIRDAA